MFYKEFGHSGFVFLFFIADGARYDKRGILPAPNVETKEPEENKRTLLTAEKLELFKHAETLRNVITMLNKKSILIFTYPMRQEVRGITHG